MTPAENRKMKHTRKAYGKRKIISSGAGCRDLPRRSAERKERGLIEAETRRFHEISLYSMGEGREGREESKERRIGPPEPCTT